MATYSRGLCIVLTLWLAALRPSAAVRSGTPDSVWWGTKESKDLQEIAWQHLRAGNLLAVEADYQRCVDRARTLKDHIAESRCLFGIANTHVQRFDFEGALPLYLQARDAAAHAQDRLGMGAIELNISALYLQSFDEQAALRSAEAAQSAIEGREHVYYEPQLLLQLGRLHQQIGDQPGEPWLIRGIEAARSGSSGESSMVAVEASIWDALGEEQLDSHRLEKAERSYLRAFLLRRLSWPRDLGYSYAHLGALNLALAENEAPGQHRQQLLEEAETLTIRSSAETVTLPRYRLRHQLGRVHLAQGKRKLALEDFSAALDDAEAWLSGIPAVLSSLDSATRSMRGIFDTFVEEAGSYGIDTGENLWTERSLEAAEWGRATNPKYSKQLAEIWRKRMPAAFWDTLGNLRSEEARLLRSGRRESEAADQFKSRLSEMEAQAGLGFVPKNLENFHRSDSLTHIRNGLSDSEVLLSFTLAAHQSLLWVITKEAFNTYRLAPREQIRAAVREFREAVEDGRADSGTLGQHLCAMLFGQIGSEEARKPHWLLSLDDELFRVPFAALVTGKEPSLARRTVYLAEAHSFQVVPGALLLSERVRDATQPRAGGFLGVGDPIYNVADPRWRGTFPSWFARLGAGRDQSWADQLNRLPGSGREVEACARAWGASPGETTLLEGGDANAQKFQIVLRGNPAVIHLATHVSMPEGQLDRAALAFTLDSTGHAQGLHSEEIGLLHTPGALVVMTGCSTAGGPLAGVGLAGLARSWDLAGASAVIATQWPVKDFSGQILPRFYRYLRTSTAAEALQKSQVDEIHAGAPPSAWAAYQVFGEGRQ